MKHLVVAIGAVLVLASCTQNKTAYVDNTKLIQDYEEMKEAQAKFTKQSESMSMQMDSVGQQFQKDVQDYQQNANSMSETERQQAETQLRQRQQQLQQQQQVQQQQLRQESDVVIDSIITKVKDYVSDYGEKNGYTYIFGSNESANIMYAKDGLDLTEELLEKINADYNGEGGSESKTEEKEVDDTKKTESES